MMRNSQFPNERSFSSDGLRPASAKEVRGVRAGAVAPSGVTDPGSPPLLIGGVNSQSGHKAEPGRLEVDYIRASFVDSNLDQVEALIREYWPDYEVKEYDYGIDGYERKAVVEGLNVILAWDERDARRAIHAGRALISIPGAALHVLAPLAVYELCQDLTAVGVRATRLDVCFEDYRRRVDPEEVYNECIAGNVSGFRRLDYRAPRFVGGKVEGKTLYLGRRGKSGGEKYMRIYDKALEADDQERGIRFEIEFTGPSAAGRFFAISTQQSFPEWLAYLGGLIGGAVHFVQRSSKPREKNIGRMDYLPWWSEILDIIGSVKYAVPRSDRSLFDKEKWLRSQVSVSLNLMREYYAEGFRDFLDELLQHGQDRTKRHHRDLVERAQRALPEESHFVPDRDQVEYWRAVFEEGRYGEAPRIPSGIALRFNRETNDVSDLEALGFGPITLQ